VKIAKYARSEAVEKLLLSHLQEICDGCSREEITECIFAMLASPSVSLKQVDQEIFRLLVVEYFKSLQKQSHSYMERPIINEIIKLSYYLSLKPEEKSKIALKVFEDIRLIVKESEGAMGLVRSFVFYYAKVKVKHGDLNYYYENQEGFWLTRNKRVWAKIVNAKDEDLRSLRYFLQELPKDHQYSPPSKNYIKIYFDL